jgi:four helix bundle protein
MEGSFRELIVYRKAFDFAMRIYEVTKSFPKEEKYELIDQIRRSSRAYAEQSARDIENASIQSTSPVK